MLAEQVGEGDAEAVIARAHALLEGMTEEQKIAVLNAHPRIGARSGLSARAAAEQRTTDSTDPATLRTLDLLNADYERRFGFRFVVFVHGRSRAEIVPVLRARLGRSRDEELATGLAEFLAIARDRLEKR